MSEKRPGITAQTIPTREQLAYKSPLDVVTPKDGVTFDKIESFEGSVADLFSSVEKGIADIKNNELSELGYAELFYRTYEVIKMLVEEKIHVDRFRKGYVEDAIQAIRLSLELAKACDLHDGDIADKSLSDLKELIATSPLKTIMNKKLKESPDYGIMPEHPGEEDRRLAKELTEKTNGQRILVIAIGHRGVRRALDIYLDYCFATRAWNSDFWVIRYSKVQGDKLPRTSYMEEDMLREMAQGKTVVIIGPEDRIQLTTDFLKPIFPKEIPLEKVPLPVAEEKNDNNHNLERLKKRNAIVKKTKK